MALENILEKIDDQTKKALATLRKEAESKEAELRESFTVQRETVQSELTASYEDAKSKVFESAESQATRERNNLLLAAKHEVIQEALDSTIANLASSSDYQQILTDMLSATDLDGTVEVVPAKGKEDETKQALSESGKPYTLSSDSVDIQGGFILRADSIEIDNSFEAIIKGQMRSDLEIQLHKLLFT